ncbi:MAG TPA: dihydrolipoamide acetyltransferase family protein, partial [Chloroflexota bacterium]
MATTVVMPKMGYDMTHGKIVRWLKKEGDRVERGEPIAEIETEKVNIEIESYASGVLSRILAREGQDVPVGEPIAIIGEPGETVSEEAVRREPAPMEQAPAWKEGAGEGAETMGTTLEAYARELPQELRMAAPPERVKASPIARRLAEERGVQLEAIRGTGPGGRITKEDVERYVREQLARPGPPGPPPAAPPARPAPPVAAAAPAAVVAPPEYEEVEPSRMRRAIARHMVQSKQTIPHFYLTLDVDATEALRLRQELNAMAAETERISVNDLVMKAAARALQGFPNLNAAYVDDKIRRFRQINVGFAVSVDDG